MPPDGELKNIRNETPGRSDIAGRGLRRPFDTAELDKVPRPTADDPPYRPWWVM
jgi:hypothetical protein